MTDYLSVREVAERCHVHPKTIERAIHRGELRASKLAGRGCWVIQPEDLHTWIEARANRPRDTAAAPINAAPRAARRARRDDSSLTGLLTDDMGRSAA